MRALLAACGAVEMTPHEMADVAFMSSGFPSYLMVPQVVWVKDYSGQVTSGRIGRPDVQYAPVDWLPQKVGDEVKAIWQEMQCKARSK